MLLLVSLLLVSLLLIFLLKSVSLLISESALKNREELSSYECGFEHNSLSRVPFSLRYFFLTLLFLLFDLEVILMLFLPFSLFSSLFVVVLFVVVLFVVVLFVGLMYE
jgi:NADH-ubiquinone oxidoreductase chain 3